MCNVFLPEILRGIREIIVVEDVGGVQDAVELDATERVRNDE